MLKEDPSLEEKFLTLIMGMERELKSRHIEDPNQYEDINVDLGGPMNSNDNLYDSKHQMSASFNREAALAAFIEANQDVLFPEWMIREAGGKSWKGMGVKDVLDLSNLYGTKFYDKLGPQEDGEQQEQENPSDIVRGQQGLKNLKNRLMPGAGDEVAADEQPTAVFEQPAVKNQGLSEGPVAGDNEQFWEDYNRDMVNAEAKRTQQELDNEAYQKYVTSPEFAKWTPGQVGGRGKNRYEILRGANVKTASLEQQLVNFYINVGIEPKTAAIFVQSVGEMAQLQQSNPGLPIAAPDPETMDINKEIGGKEGDKYQNWHIDDKQRELDIEHQDFTDFGEPVREFIQPGGEAPYSENTSDKIDEGAESVDMGASNVTQADNAPKKSSAKEDDKEDKEKDKEESKDSDSKDKDEKDSDDKKEDKEEDKKEGESSEKDEDNG
jgi:hypothetical protein